MNAIAVELANYLVERLKITPANQRILVGLAGIPASGKSTLGALIVKYVNIFVQDNDDPSQAPHNAVFVGLDGWHLTRAQLDTFPDPKLAHDLRGAHWTFDSEAYVDFVKRLREPLADTTLSSTTSRPITAPSFDHAIKDPTPAAVQILPTHRIVLIEGLYTFLSIDPWVNAGKLLDERWFIDVDIDEARHRLIKRHVLTGVGRDMEDAIWRADNNDMPNGRFIIEHVLEPTRRIPSVEDSVFKTNI